MKKVLFLLVVLVCQISSSQEFIVKGIVAGKNGIRLSKPQIINLNRNTHVFANFDGDYSIKVKVGDTLYFKSSTDFKNCYTTAKRIVYNQDSINVELLRKDEVRFKYCQSKSTSLLVFVGKIDFVREIEDPCHDVMNDYFIGQYEIIEKVYGVFNKEIGELIKFNFSEHGNIDSFYSNEHKIALIYVERYCDNQYYMVTHRDVLPTDYNRWAINYNPNRKWYYKNIDSLENKMSKIEFQNASFRVKRQYINEVRKGYPEPFYKTKGRRFYPVLGFYVEDYFKLWKAAQKEWNYDN